MSKKEEASVFTFNAKDIPTDPGCYLFYGEKDEDLLYVGKAKHLRKRVTSYFQKEHDVTRLQVLVSKIRRIDTRVVNSEMEALVLENNLIKQYMPRYNVKLRDDKNFVYLRITNEETPKMEIVRRFVKDGSTYIGPRTSSKNFKNLVRFCQKHFRIQMVKESQNYYPHLQAGLLEEEPAVYRERVGVMKQFLNGKTSGVVKELQAKMMQFAGDKNFEAAAKVRDLMVSIDIATEKQIVAEFQDGVDRDCVHFYRMGEWAYFVRIAFRYGKMLHQNELEVKAPSNIADEEILRNFLLQFYPKVVDIAQEILLPYELEDADEVAQYLSDTCFEGRKVTFVHPQIGDKKAVLDVAYKNAEYFGKKKQVEALNSSDNFTTALPELVEALQFDRPLKRIECYDISHFSGQDTVASMVVFTEGKPDTSEYRRFKIKTLEEGKIDDFESMREVLHRRFARMFMEKEKEQQKKDELSMKRVETDAEWAAYHMIREREVFGLYWPDVKYDKDHKDEKKKKNHPMVFVQDGQIVGTVRLDEKGKTMIAVRAFAIEKSLQRKGLGTKALELVEAWANNKDKKKIVMNSRKEVISFYGRNGYEPDIWKGDSKDEDCIPLGKKLVVQEKWPLPDLIVIDGGKGQLSAVMDVFKEKKYANIKEDIGFDPVTQIISLAKREELIYRPGATEEIALGLDSPALQLLQRLRDEAHRFAITFNRALRKKAAHKSILDEIDGIGGVTKKKLLMTFGSVKEIREATDTDLLNILNKKQLENLRRSI